MNASSDRNPEAIRSEIGQTRQRMDDTMDALGDRLQPRHLLDEVLGYFRGNDGDGNPRLQEVRRKITAGADHAMHAVADTVKKNPVPALLIGAGVAWMIYESRRGHSDDRDRRGYDAERYDPDAYLDRPLEYPSGRDSSSGGNGGSKLAHLKEEVGEKAAAVGEQVKEKLADAGTAMQQTYETAKARAGEMTDRVRERTAEAYTRTRDRVVTTAQEHPLEVGLVGLAAGLIAGLLLPTPDVVHRSVGGAADRLRDRARESGSEMLAKGKRVAQAAVSAVKDEAQAQGLTPERLREQASAVAERAGEAGQEKAREEGLAPASPGNQSGSVSIQPI